MTSAFPAPFGAQILLLACAIAFLAGFVKGTAGFAMPMIMVSGLASFLSPELALAGLIVPTLVTNGLQALRDGLPAARGSLHRYRLFLGIGAICLIASGQLVRSIDPRVLYAVIGGMIMLFGITQLAGVNMRIAPGHRRRAEIGLGVLSGTVGGVSGIWGPPLVAYLTAIDTPKAEQMRVQGVAFGAGAVLLLATHLQTGVLNARTLPFSLLLLGPALAGMWLGLRAHDRLDQAGFRRLTLAVLVVAGLNLLRRALF
ncbi:sulfite exporter TauE/SafE family protein [Tropicimonas sp. IMCC34043]|uniref:sulfite exporter TauE/SafE family protein n=1 Tax=Tropicimonas sp. IMCC34043 TaxID=2248760 RepID=UPI000E244B13|nr:sulfite exporter TauE/SafE family protein [Tropicimonas sp. IMCC34043]